MLIQAQWLDQEAQRGDVEVSASALRNTFETAATPALNYARMMRLRRDLAMQMDVPAKDVAAYYRKNVLRYSRPEERVVHSIAAKSRGKAEAVRQAVVAGESWERTARRYAVGVSGPIGTLVAPPVDPFTRAAFAAQPHELRGPLKTSFGWYVFRVESIKQASRQSLAKVADTIRFELGAAKLDRLLRAHYADETACAPRYRELKISECVAGRTL